MLGRPVKDKRKEDVERREVGGREREREGAG